VIPRPLIDGLFKELAPATSFSYGLMSAAPAGWPIGRGLMGAAAVCVMGTMPMRMHLHRLSFQQFVLPATVLACSSERSGCDGWTCFDSWYDPTLHFGPKGLRRNVGGRSGFDSRRVNRNRAAHAAGTVLAYAASGGGLSSGGAGAVMALTTLAAVVDLRMAGRMHHRGCRCVLMPDAVV